VTPRERDFVAGLCAARAGLNIETERAYVIESAMSALARREGFASVADILRAIRDRGDERLTWMVVEAMAPGACAFFRDEAVFEALAAGLQAAVRAGASPRVWSAACGSGQEIYSLGMLLEERAVDGVELFASDLSARRLEKAQGGLYSHYEIQQGLTARRLVRHFRNHDEAFVVRPELSRQVRWRRINLLDRPELGSFDLILCRYTLGGLLPAARERVAAYLASALKPGGRLVLGAGETLPPSCGLEPDAVAGVFERPALWRAAA